MVGNLNSKIKVIVCIRLDSDNKWNDQIVTLMIDRSTYKDCEY